jgi:hypothetical protein
VVWLVRLLQVLVRCSFVVLLVLVLLVVVIMFVVLLIMVLPVLMCVAGHSAACHCAGGCGAGGHGAGGRGAGGRGAGNRGAGDQGAAVRVAAVWGAAVRGSAVRGAAVRGATGRGAAGGGTAGGGTACHGANVCSAASGNGEAGRSAEEPWCCWSLCWCSDAVGGAADHGDTGGGSDDEDLKLVEEKVMVSMLKLRCYGEVGIFDSKFKKSVWRIRVIFSGSRTCFFSRLYPDPDPDKK